MRFIDKRKLYIKVAHAHHKVSQRLKENIVAVHPIFSLMPFYLGAFYDGVVGDKKSTDFLHVLANSEELQIFVLSKTLVLYFIWQADRLDGIPLVDDPSVITGLVDIWTFREDTYWDFIKSFDAEPLENVALKMWGYIMQILGDNSLSPTFELVHIRNAYHFVQSKNGLGKIIK